MIGDSVENIQDVEALSGASLRSHFEVTKGGRDSGREKDIEVARPSSSPLGDTDRKRISSKRRSMGLFNRLTSGGGDSPDLSRRILNAYRTNKEKFTVQLRDLRDRFRERMSRARERRAQWARDARARGRCTCKCSIVPHMHGNPFPPFGVAEVIFVLFAFIAAIAVPLKALDVGQTPAWSNFTEYTIFVVAFFATFGLRQLLLQSVLLVVIIAFGTWAMSADEVDKSSKLDLHLMGALSLIGLF